MYRDGVIALVVVLLVAAAPEASARRNERSRRGAIKVDTPHSGAVVSVDGKVIGCTPLKGVAVPAGTRRLTVKKLGHEAFNRKIEVRAGVTHTVPVELRPFAGVLDLSASVPGTTVLLDGKSLGGAPVKREIDVGKHEVEVRAPGHRRATHELTAQKGSYHRFAAKLVKHGSGRSASTNLELVSLDPTGDSAASSGVPGRALAALPEAEASPGTSDGVVAAAPAGAIGDMAAGLALLELTPPPPDPEAFAAAPPPEAQPDARANSSPDAAVSLVVEPAKPWYLQWWAWTAAGTVVAAGVTTAALLFSGRSDGHEGQSVEAVWLLHLE